MVPLFLPITWSSFLSWSEVHVPVNALIAQQHFEAPQHYEKAKNPSNSIPCFYFSEILMAR